MESRRFVVVGVEIEIDQAIEDAKPDFFEAEQPGPRPALEAVFFHSFQEKPEADLLAVRLANGDDHLGGAALPRDIANSQTAESASLELETLQELNDLTGLNLVHGKGCSSNESRIHRSR